MYNRLITETMEYKTSVHKTNSGFTIIQLIFMSLKKKTNSN